MHTKSPEMQIDVVGQSPGEEQLYITENRPLV